MLDKNKEYKAITNLRETIDEAHRLQKKVDDVENKIAKQKAIDLKVSQKAFPYGKMLEEKKMKLKYPTLLQRLTLFVIVFTVYALFFVLPALVAYVADMRGLYTMRWFYTDRNHIIVASAVYIGVIIITALTVRKVIRFINGKLFDLRDHHYNKKHKKAFNEAYVESKDMIEDYKRIIESEIDSLESQLVKLNSELEHVQKTIENNAQIPKKHIKDVDKILMYFEDMRATKTQEAVNLLVTEQREERFHQELLETLNRQIEATKALETDLHTLSEIKESLEKRPLVETEKPEDPIDAKLKKRPKKLSKKEKAKLKKKQKKDKLRAKKEDRQLKKIEKKKQKDQPKEDKKNKEEKPEKTDTETTTS